MIIPELIIPDKKDFFPTQRDFSETARYLGYKKLENPDEVTSQLIENCCKELFEVINPKAAVKVFLLEKNDLSTGQLIFADVDFISKDLSRNLRDCKEVILLAATIGPQVDSTIRKNQIVNPVKAAIFQAAGAMFIEKFVDNVNLQIKKIVAEEEKQCKPRFSPGYGDVSLNLQKDFFRLLPCAKIGLTLMDTLIMSPEKSVTAFIGISE